MAITYSIDSGADAAKFNIDATTGKLTFKTAPDFENPGDANKDNIYEVTVKATDAGGAATTQNVRVTVTDVSENAPPQITSAAAVTVAENTTAVMTVTAIDPDGGTPPIDPPPVSGSYDDGFAGAPTGTANAPTLLQEYGSNRPPWKVAGVDYRCGIQTGKTLRDWRSVNIAGCSVSGNLYRVDADNVVIDSVDFTLGGMGTMIYGPSARNVTVTNCKLGGLGAAAISSCYIIAGNGLTARYNEFIVDGKDGSGLIGAGGTVVIEYNYGTDFPQHVFETGSSTDLTYRYNYFRRGGRISGSHFNVLQQMGNNVTNKIKFEFNTFLQDLTPGDGEGVQFDLKSPGTSGTLTNCTCSFNCFLAKQGGNVSYWIHGPANYSSADTCNVTNRTPVTGGLKFQENYFDITGAYGEFYGNSLNADCDLQGNKNIKTGAAVVKTAFNTCELADKRR